ncbi:MAG: FAD/NAD(P)-binding protein [Verrucomicrobiota bacterium]
MNLDWLIVGGGIHGVHIAARLIGEAGVERESLYIVDPGCRLLARWRACTATTGMPYLRSPSVHHLDLDPWSLTEFAGGYESLDGEAFVSPYGRPALTLFNTHCDHVVDKFGLSDLHIRDRVVTCSATGDRVVVRLASGLELAAGNMVLAIGAGEQPEWPDWAPRGDARVQHVFDPEGHAWPSSPETVVVVGGGISAGQVALRLIKEGHHVHLVSRHALRRHQFDSDPGWLGPKLMTGFNREKDPARRRALIVTARHRGSVPPEISDQLGRAIAEGQLHWHQAQVEDLEMKPDGIALRLTNTTGLETQRVLLAMGFESRRPGGSMVDSLIDSAALPCADCGYPIVDSALRWHPRVYVSGPLAELELGPSARNIAGARRAADRLVGVARENGFANVRRAS